MDIEEASTDDNDILKRLAETTIHASVDASVDSKREIVGATWRHIDTHLAGSDRVFLKYTDSTILGFILVRNYWNLSDLFVLPSAQGIGIGRRLLDGAKTVCEDAGPGFIRVNSSLNAENFYRRSGFVAFLPDGDVPNFVVPLVYRF